MGKKNTNAAAKAARKAKAQAKIERKEKKKVLGGGKAGGAKGKGKGGGDDDNDEDLEAILDSMRREWEAAHTVTEEIASGPPSRRANATLTPCPATGAHLWMFGGEFYSEDNKAYFYNDTYRYTPEKDEWRRYVSPTAPGPRSAHALVGSPMGGGKLFMFGGEFSSLNQTSFHHYRDFWSFDVPTHTWERIEPRGPVPSARSGHRMVMWKHFVVLFGGFYDPGVTTRYHNDLWVFDTHTYTWHPLLTSPADPKPSPRSGFSFLPFSGDSTGKNAGEGGAVLHGGYCKEYKKGQRPVGVCLDDTWVLRLALVEPPSSSADTRNNAKTKSTPTPAQPNVKAGKKQKLNATGKNASTSAGPAPVTAKWERRKRPSDAFAPCLRSGCTMALWAAKGMGVMFGGVTDEEEGEEGLRSRFWGDMYGYQLGGKGRWVSFTVRVPKQKGGKGGGGKGKKGGGGGGEESEDEWGDLDKVAARIEASANAVSGNHPSKGLEDDGDDSPQAETKQREDEKEGKSGPVDLTADVEDPLLTTPRPRYNTMLAVLRNTAYIYGGIFERGSHEYTLDDFYSVQLDRMERFVCLRKSGVVIPEGEEESSSGSEDEDEDEDDEEEEEEEEDIRYSDDDDDLGGQGAVEDEDEDGDGDEEEGESGAKSKRKMKVEREDEDADGDDESDSSKPKSNEAGKEKRKTRRERKLEQATAFSLAAQGISPSSTPLSQGDAEHGDEPEASDLRKKATGFMGASNDATRTEEEVLSTPLPGETLAVFYARSRVYWTQRAQSSSPQTDLNPKELRRIAFSLASERYEEYKPVLEEVEKILKEAGLDEEEMRRVGAGGKGGGGGKGEISRNRR